VSDTYHKHRTLFAFDIETVPDTDVVPNLLGPMTDDVAARRQALGEYHLRITGGKNDFLRQPFHKVATISFVAADIERDGERERYHLREIRSGGEVGSSERDLLAGVFQYIERKRPRLITFNGRTFDVPVLKYRAMVHGVQAGWFHNGGNKWESYGSRYSLDWHCDLIDALSDNGASARVRLDEVCSVLGFPGKFGTDGSQVMDLYDQGKLQEIRDYCETDAANTYLVYLRFMQHKGRLLTTDYNAAVQDLVNYLEVEAAERPHLGEFLTAWGESCGGRFYLPE
jgi:predicted PolB exonuclease-like 3'-5' exonuclease